MTLYETCFMVPTVCLFYTVGSVFEHMLLCGAYFSTCSIMVKQTDCSGIIIFGCPLVLLKKNLQICQVVLNFYYTATYELI